MSNNTAINDLDEPGWGWTASEEQTSVYFVIFLTLLAFVIILSKWLRSKPRLHSYFPEAGLIIIVGIISGAMVHLVANADTTTSSNNDDDAEENVVKEVLSFDPDVFFLVLLPPIIFNSGYSLRRELLLRHITPITLFASIGTTLSALFIAILLQIASKFELTGAFHPTFSELLTFGALISATDPVSTLAVFQAKRVDPHLFVLVFGESVLNDAVGLVLFNSFSKLVGHEHTFEKVVVAVISIAVDFVAIFASSLVLGLVSGFLAGLLFRCIDMRLSYILELSLYVLVMYVPFFVADALGLSGIVTILFTGITSKSYAEPNLSPSSTQEANSLFRVTAFLAETSIFLELGLSVFGLTNVERFHGYFILWACLGCLLGRAFFIYPICWGYNKWLRRKRVRERCEDGIEGDKSPSVGRSRSLEDDETDITYRGIQESFSSSSSCSRSDSQFIQPKIAHMLWFAGLRGAVAYACAKTFPDHFGHRTAFVFTTMSIVLITVFVFGGGTTVALRCCGVDIDVDEDEYLARMNSEWIGTFQDFERRYILPCVLRHEDIPQKIEEPSSPPNNLPNDLVLHPETTTENETEDDFVNIQRMKTELELREMTTSPRKKLSLYDYGKS